VANDDCSLLDAHLMESSLMAVRLENLVETPEYAVFSTARNAVVIWKQPPVPEGIDACKRLFTLLARRSKEKFAYLAIVESRAGINMPTEVRETLTAMLREYQQSIAASAIVFEEAGFRASIVRSVVSAISIATRLDFPSTVESQVVNAAYWLAEHVEKDARINAVELIEAVRQFRSRPGYEADVA
jgi:hypothetical protein